MFDILKKILDTEPELIGNNLIIDGVTDISALFIFADRRLNFKLRSPVNGCVEYSYISTSTIIIIYYNFYFILFILFYLVLFYLFFIFI